MKLQSITQDNLIFMEEITRQSQRTGNEYTQIKLANTEEFENYTFYKTDTINTVGLKKGDKVKAIFQLVPQGFNNNLNLTELHKV